MKITTLLIGLVLLFVPVKAEIQETCAITENTPPTVSVDWLSKHINHKNLVLLHVGRKADYDKGHIPNAQFISLADISIPRKESKLSLQLPSIEKLKATFEKFGVSNDSRIILYFGKVGDLDEHSKHWVPSVTRVYFTLDYLGLRKNTSILDIGMPAWTAAGKSISKDIPTPKRGNLKVKANDSFVAKADWLSTTLKDRSVKIIDARDAVYYDGSKPGSYPRPGHIQGAKNIPYTNILDENNKFRDEASLRKLFTEAGVKPYDTVVVYCHIGQQASLVYFAARKLGYKVKLYDGSFQEWSANEKLAVEDPNAGKRGTRVSIVTPKWVEEHANDKNVRILDVRLNVYDYFTGHIPNAVHLADAAMRAPREGYPTQYLDPSMTSRLLAQAGIRKDDKVVIYSDGSGVLGATMIAYILERLGQKEILFVDGGWQDYKTSFKVTQEYPKYKLGNFALVDNKKIRANLEDVKNSIGKKGVVFIDARPPDVYRGEKKIWTRNGHIPGAINIPWVKLMEENNRHKLKPNNELGKVFIDAGVKPTDDIIVYCGTSREASLEYMILKHILRLPKVRLYEGSWAEYSNHPQLRVEKGPGK